MPHEVLEDDVVCAEGGSSLCAWPCSGAVLLGDKYSAPLAVTRACSVELLLSPPPESRSSSSSSNCSTPARSLARLTTSRNSAATLRFFGQAISSQCGHRHIFFLEANL